jgi:hypothetical protein
MNAQARFVVAACMLAAIAAPASAAIITQNEPAPSLATVNCKVSNDGNGRVLLGLEAEFLSMAGAPVILQFRLDGNDVVGSLPRGFSLVNYDNLADPNVTILNSTGVAWQSFQMLLVNNPVFIPHADAAYAPGGGVGCDPFGSPAADSNSTAMFFGGDLSSGGAAMFTGIKIDDNGQDGGIFYLKLFPTPTPDPGTLALLSAGALGFVRLRRQRAMSLSK